MMKNTCILIVAFLIPSKKFLEKFLVEKKRFKGGLIIVLSEHP